MSISRNNQFSKAWMVADSHATLEYVLTLPERMASDPAIGALSSTSINLQGSAIGCQIQGDVASVRKDLDSIADKSFSTANLTTYLNTKGNAQINFNLHFAQRLVNVTLTNTNESTARTIFDSLLQLLPEQSGISQSELATKADRLTVLIKLAESLNTTAAELQKAGKEINDLAVTAKKASDTATVNATESEKQKQLIQSNQTQIVNFRQEAEKRLGEINTVKTQVQGTQAAVQQHHQSTTTHEAAIKEFFGRIDENKKKLSDAETTTATITKKNTELQKQIDELLIKAVGIGLFGAFDTRKQQLVTAKWIWACCTLLVTLIQVGIVIWLAIEAKELGVQSDTGKLLSPLFLLKATAAIPVFFLIGFCVTQYSHERKHEETYAFKSALSFSLAPYLDLVKKIPEQSSTEKYREFVISTIGQVFSPPQQADDPKGDKAHKMLGEVNGLLDSVGKFVERVKR